MSEQLKTSITAITVRSHAACQSLKEMSGRNGQLTFQMSIINKYKYKCKYTNDA